MGLKGLAWGIILGFIGQGKMLSQADVNIKAGIETWAFADEQEASNPSKHPGQMMGLDVFVEKGRGLFVPGFHYHRFTVTSEAKSFELDLRSARHFHYFTIPLLFGYKVTDESVAGISVLAGPEVQFFYDINQNAAGLDDDMMHGVSTSLTAALHAEMFSFLTLELRYHHGLQRLIKFRDESKLRGVSIALGVKL